MSAAVIVMLKSQKLEKALFSFYRRSLKFAYSLLENQAWFQKLPTPIGSLLKNRVSSR